MKKLYFGAQSYCRAQKTRLRTETPVVTNTVPVLSVDGFIQIKTKLHSNSLIKHYL